MPIGPATAVRPSSTPTRMATTLAITTTTPTCNEGAPSRQATEEERPRLRRGRRVGGLVRALWHGHYSETPFVTKIYLSACAPTFRSVVLPIGQGEYRPTREVSAWSGKEEVSRSGVAFSYSVASCSNSR